VYQTTTLAPLLEEIYHTYQPNEDNYQIREFYWTIRSMTGPRAMQLRKLIRDEVGMDHLR
jgi:hypothetical protein